MKYYHNENVCKSNGLNKNVQLLNLLNHHFRRHNDPHRDAQSHAEQFDLPLQPEVLRRRGRCLRENQPQEIRDAGTIQHQ